MSSPRHLWSKDWEADSAAAAEALARLRAETHAVAPAAETIPERPPRQATPVPQGSRAGSSPRTPRPARKRREWDWAAFTAWIRRRWQALVDLVRRDGLVRATLVAALIVICLAGVSYAAASYLGGSGGPGSSASAQAPGWLGIEMASTSTGVRNIGSNGIMTFSSGVLITDVVPGSPAAISGLAPGDLITQIAGVPVSTPKAVDRVLANLTAGDSVEIQYEQGALDYATEATLGVQPAGSP